MLCDSCKKKNATFHYTKIINDEIEEIHLCEVCAIENQEIEFENPFSIHKLFSSLFGNIEDKEEEEIEDITCSECGLTLKKFQKTGKLGCAQCYDSFSDYLKPVINGIHGNMHHRGKVPLRISSDIALEMEVKKLMLKLEDAVKDEEFEQAAIIRDEIRRVKEKLHVDEE